MPMTLEKKGKLSIVVPLYNEEGNVTELHRQIVQSLTLLPDWDSEIIFVDDGSTDNTCKECLDLTPLILVKLRKNFGQTAAFDAGFKQASGDIIVTLDGDLQNDPNDIPALLAKMDEGYDVVSGWRKSRKDTLSKKITSRSANMLRKFFFKDTIHDSGCALKVYKRDCFNDLDLYGEMHRFIPALLEHQGYRAGEVVVNHRPRLHGQSKYGNLKRGLKSLTDMISVWFWGRYSARPLHIFGSTGLICVTVGSGVLVVMFILRLALGFELAERIWPLVGVFLIITGVQLFMIGIVSDVLSKIYYRSHGRMNYSIKETIRN